MKNWAARERSNWRGFRDFPVLLPFPITLFHSQGGVPKPEGAGMVLPAEHMAALRLAMPPSYQDLEKVDVPSWKRRWIRVS